MGPYGSKHFKTLVLLQFSSDLSQIAMGKYAFIVDLPKIKKKYGTLKFFGGYIGPDISKKLLLQFSSALSQTL